jgi:hypothetical protein
MVTERIPDKLELALGVIAEEIKPQDLGLSRVELERVRDGV